MRTSLIIKEIERLPIQKRMIVVEKTIKSIREADLRVHMKVAADKLYKDYMNDTELTAFKEIDFEDFYEAR
jgi:hypothetical protein